MYYWTSWNVFDELAFQWQQIKRRFYRLVCRLKGHQWKLYMCRRCGAPNLGKPVE